MYVVGNPQVQKDNIGIIICTLNERNFLQIHIVGLMNSGHRAIGCFPFAELLDLTIN